MENRIKECLYRHLKKAKITKDNRITNVIEDNDFDKIIKELISIFEDSESEVKLINEQKLGDSFIDWKKMSPEKQWSKIDRMLHEAGLKVVKQ